MSRSAIRHCYGGIRYISAKPSVPAACPKTCPYHGNRYGERNSEKQQEDHQKDVWNKVLKKHMEEKGVNREVCEAKIAQMKQDREAGLTYEAQSYILRMYEDWLEMLTRDST